MTNLPFTLRQLEVFEALSRTRSFRLTAEQFAISQAAVSNHIKALEQQLGTPLFVRRAGRPPELSLEGLAFLSDLGPFLEKAKKLAEHRRAAIEKTGSRALRVYVGLHLLENYVRPKLDDFFMANPSIAIDFVSNTSGPEVLRQILCDKFDVALFHAMPGQELDEHCRIVAHCRAGIFAHEKLLPEDGHELSIEELDELPYVFVQADAKDERSPFTGLIAAGIHPSRIVGRAQYYDVVAKLVERGIGASYICESFIQAAKRPEIRLVRPIGHWRLAVRRAPDLRDPGASAVEELLTACVLHDERYPAL
jgi:DNA-binding transcriptional LysR family regulator